MLISLNDLLGNRVIKEVSLPDLSYDRKPAKVWFCDNETEEKLSHYYHNSHAYLPTQSLYRLNDVKIRGKGIITIDKRVIKENIEGAPIETIQQNLSKETKANKIIEDPVLYTTRYGVKNYGHCLTDIIPRIQWFHQLYPGIRIIIHKEMPKQIFEVLALLGINKDKMILLGDELVNAKTLYFVNLWNQHPLIHSTKTFQILEDIKKQTQVKGWRFKSRPKKIFVNRNDAHTRHIINHREVSRYLKQKGFSEISTGKLSIKEQIHYFSEAEHVIGISGAAMTNIVFSEPHTKVLNLSPSSMPSLYFWDIAHHANVDYAIAYFAATHKEKILHSDFFVNLSILEEMLAALD